MVPILFRHAAGPDQPIDAMHATRISLRSLFVVLLKMAITVGFIVFTLKAIMQGRKASSGDTSPLRKSTWFHHPHINKEARSQ